MMLVYLTSILMWPALAVLDSGPIPRNTDEMLVRDHTVRILREIDGGRRIPFCSGAVGSSNEVLSVGHCFNEARLADVNQGKIFVEVYDKNSTPPLRQFKVAGIRQKNANPIDLALLRIHDAMPPNFSVPRANGPCDAGSPVYASGFGILDKSYKFPVQSRIARLKSAASAHRGLLRFDRSKEMPCMGDSGGPIFCKVRGVLSLASVISHSRDGQPRSVAAKPDREFTEICKLDDRIYGSDLTNNEQLLNQWRDELAPSPPPDGDGNSAR